MIREISPKTSKVGDGIKGGMMCEGFERLMIKLENLTDEYGICLESYERDCDKIHSCLREILGLMEMQAIEYYYLHARPWDEVARMMNISTSYVFKLHRRALDKLDSFL